jgi:HSP20 family protein
MSQCSPANRVNQFLPTQLSDVDSLLNHFFTPNPRAQAARAGWSTPASLFEDDDRLYIKIDAPGVTAEKVDITVENNQLSVTLERTNGEKPPQYVYNERRFGKVTRTLDLPDTVDPESIEAELTAGVLRVSIAKRPETLPRKVEVRQN